MTFPTASVPGRSLDAILGHERVLASGRACIVPIASLPCELYVTFSFFSSGCRSPSLPSPMPSDDGINSLPRYDRHDSLLLFDRTAPGASMTRMTKYEFPPYRPRHHTNAEVRSWYSPWLLSSQRQKTRRCPRLKRDGRTARCSTAFAGERRWIEITSEREGGAAERERDGPGMSFGTSPAFSFFLALAALRRMSI